MVGLIKFIALYLGIWLVNNLLRESAIADFEEAQPAYGGDKREGAKVGKNGRREGKGMNGRRKEGT